MAIKTIAADGISTAISIAAKAPADKVPNVAPYELDFEPLELCVASR
jgi:hypothetical protein